MCEIYNYSCIQNLGQRIYQTKAQNVNNLR